MKICLLAAACCIHTIRWANGLAKFGQEVVLLSQHPLKESLDKSVTFHFLPYVGGLGYILNSRVVRKHLHAVKPDILNVHFASGYGLLANLAGFSPMLLSVLGSDVYDFPKRSFFHKLLLRWNLRKADAIASTSNCMAAQTRRIHNHSHVFITPFGVEVDKFMAIQKPHDLVKKIIIGTVKKLEWKYGIDILIQAFAKVWKYIGMPDNLFLEICGEGEKLHQLKALATSLGVVDRVSFHGRVPHAKVPHMLRRMDIYVALSRFDSESFGVAILEAAACEKPVVVSDAQGLAEVTVDHKMGFVVPKGDVDAAAHAIMRLIQDEALRKKMGRFGRQHVKMKYAWHDSVRTMIHAYEKTIEISAKGSMA
jgi:L-malate glycosyltransferase